MHFTCKFFPEKSKPQTTQNKTCLLTLSGENFESEDWLEKNQQTKIKKKKQWRATF
jgi:hypothetical protein